MKRIATIIFLGFIGIQLYGSHPFVRNFSKNTTHSGNQNWDIIQADYDWMYFANNKGLLEFDGTEWILYPIKNHTAVRSVYIDKQSNRIYAGAINEFGYYIRNKSGILNYVSISEKLDKNDRKFSDIWKINKIKNTIIFQADNTLFFVENDIITKKITINDKINQCTVIQNKLIVSSYNNVLQYYDGKNLKIFKNSEILKHKKVCAILAYKTNQFLVVTDLYGIYIYNGQKIEKFTTDIDGFLVKNQVFCATIKNELIAIGTVQNGIIVKNLANNTTTYSNVNKGLQNNTVLSIAFDNRNNLWLGLDRGIDYVMLNSAIMEFIGNTNQIGAGYTSKIYNKRLYLGTNQGLYYVKYDENINKIENKIIPINQIKGQIWNINEIDNILFCSCDQGLYIIDNKNKIQKIEGLNGVWTVKQLNKHKDILLGIRYNNFFIVKKENGIWKFSNKVKGFDEGAKTFYEDINGNIWISHVTNGIYRLKLDTELNSFTQIDCFDTKNGLPSLQNNSIFMYNNKIGFSTQNGFYYFDSKTTRIDKFNELNQIFGKINYSVNLFTSPKGDIWSVSEVNTSVAHKNGLNKFSIDSSSFFLLKNKMISEFEYINFLSENQILIASENGFAIIDKSKFETTNVKPKIILKRIFLTNLKDSLLTGFILNKTNNNEITRLKYSHNSIRFEYICSEFRKENSILYSYKLENYDKNWSYYSQLNSKEYSKIPPGRYNFKVKAKNLNSLEVVETSFSFVISPPWYQSLVAIIIYTILFVLLIYLLIKYIDKRTKRAAREMEIKKEKEIEEQEKQFQIEKKEKEKEIIEIKNQQLEYELRHKSQDLANSTMNVIRKNEVLLDMSNYLNSINEQLNQNTKTSMISSEIKNIQKEINNNIENDNNWNKFQENFDLVYENYLKRLGNTFPMLTQKDKKICAYLRMNLSSKDIAPLVGTTFQSVEMSRHRLRKKLKLEREVNLTDFLQNF